MRSLRLKRLTLAGLLWLAAGAARADVQAINATTVGTYPPLTNNGFNYYQPPGGYTFSWSFTANTAISVTQLGYYNSALVGLANAGGFGSHLVTLTDTTTNTTLASATVTAANSVTGDFNYAAIAPVTLNTTDTYQVSGTMTTQYYLVGLNEAAAPLASQINYDFQATNIFGTQGPPGTYSDFGANFQFTLAASCTQNVAGRNIIALAGDACSAAPGAYTPTVSTVGLPVTYNGFGFFAYGGSIDSPGNISISTNDAGQPAGRHAIWAYGAGSLITLEGTTTLTTGQTSSHGLYATGGGIITATGAVVATTSGTSSSAVYASGAGSQITLTGGVTLNTSGDKAFAVRADNGAGVSISGGSVTTTGIQGDAVYASGGGAITLANLQLTTSGNAGKGLDVEGTGSSLNGSGLTISTSGTIDTATGFHAQGVYNGSAVPPGVGTTGGGTIVLTGTSVTTSGDNSIGVETTNNGVTTFTGGSITTSGASSNAVESESGASTAIGLDSLGRATTISTSGTASYAADAAGGGFLSLTGATLTTIGNGSGGIAVNGAGSEIDATNVTISTAGTLDVASGQHSWGAFNGPDATYTVGGTLKLTDVTISTTGAGMIGVYTLAGGTTTVLGGAVTTSGVGAAGVGSGNGGSMTVGLDASGRAAVVKTSGVDAFGALAFAGGSLSLSGTQIATSANGAVGLVVNGAGTNAAASNVTIATQGGLDSTTGINAVGAYNGPGLLNTATSGGALQLSGAAISTQGAAAAGVVTGAGGVTTLSSSQVQTSGANAHAVTAQGGGSVTLVGSTLSTSGAGANGVYVTGAGSVAALNGANTISVTGAGAAGVYVGPGGAVTSAPSTAALTVTAAGNGLYLNGAATMNLSGPLALTGGAALTLSGDNAAFNGTGGGAINAAATAISLLNGVSQTASFTNYNIQSLSGDLIFADPSQSTVTFNSTTANAGTGNLADVTNNSQLTLTANASALTGAIVTLAGSVSNVTLNNGSTWTIAANSNTTNLTINNSSATFSSTGGFKTLTTTNYVGNNAILNFNAALGGAGAADQLIINGGTASGTTAIAVHTSGTPTGPISLPLVVTANGGAIAPGAFTLAGPVVSGGFQYLLQTQNGDDYLVSSQVLSSSQATGSLASLAQERQSQMVTSRVLGSILTGATEQINCSSCSSGFASFGSFALGVHGRWTLTPSLSLLAGVSYDNYTGQGVSVTGALMGALSLRYDAVQLGKYRPFAEAGVAVEPYANVTYRRSYATALGGGTGVGEAQSRSATTYGRVGYIWRLSPTDEAAAYTSLSRSLSWTSGYTESATPGNPFGALVASSLDTMNIWTVGAQYTHLFGQHIEGNLSLAYARAFAAKYGASAAINGFGDASAFAPSSFDWAELGGRVSYRFSKSLVADVFLLGTLGAQPAGNQIHGGVALRMAF